MAETKIAAEVISTPPPPSKMAHEAVREHLTKGSSLFDPRTGQNLGGSRNISVGVSPEHAVVHTSPPTPESHDDFVKAHAAILSKHVNSAVKTSYDQSTGLHKTEIAGITPSKGAAIDVAQHVGEDHVHNHATGERIPTGATGAHHIPDVSVDDRLDHLRKNSPMRTDYHGTHFSDKSIHMIDGARRGAPPAKGLPADSDMPRVRLGTKTGMGKDAPAGFYSHQVGSIPDLVSSTKPHAYSIRGHFAFADTNHPAFQAGYANGVQEASAKGAPPPIAHQLGLNSAEHALQDAGFDGYTSPKHPAIHFHFGDHAAEPVAPHVAPEHEEHAHKGNS